ncbi:nesprin-3 isoform X3 [Urocitellus parryii]
MTQQPREGFDRSAEDAEAWMAAVQEQLQVNDDTRGPRAALEARLQETEKICQREPEGRVKVDVVLRAAEALLACCPEDQKPEILARLKDIKAQWEETVTYMTHCHSRIEWVWLHWSEYLLARDEFYRWFQKMTVTLEPQVELQLGLKEKQWQLGHAQVLLHNVDNQAVLLDRLLEEAGSLFNRIGDPSVDEEAQKRMKAEYDAVRAKAQATRAALASEEPRVAWLQAQLKDLVAFPDLQPLSDSVVAAIQEYQSMKGKSTRLRNATGVELWQGFQRPLQGLQLWRALAQRLLGVTASLPDLPSIHTFLPQIEAALAESSRLKEQLAMLQLKTDLLSSIFGPEQASALLEQVASSVRDRDLLHNSLLQRKSKLQSLLDQHKDFGAAFEPLQRKLLDLQVRIQAEKGLQRDLPGKQAQLLRLQGLQEEGLELGLQIEAMQPLVQGNPNHQHKMDQLTSDHQALQRPLEDLVDRCRQSVREHCTFSHQLQELRQWVTVVTQLLESHQRDVGPWDAVSLEAEVERLLADLPEKEAQLPLVEAHGQLVMEKSSPEGAALVQAELQELAEAWRALRLLEEHLLSLIRSQQLQSTEVDTGKKLVFTNNIPKSGYLINPMDPVPRHRRGAHLLEEEGGSHEDFPQLLRNFEQWLQVENSKLVRTIAMRTSTAKDLRTRETKLQELEARVPTGQHLFENLLRLGPARGTSDELEDLRYRWMLYKSKLKDSSHLLLLSSPGDPTGFQKTQRRRRWRCGLLRKACCVALPLQMLFLLFLLLLLLLPVGEEDRSCTQANNFARSFAFMLRYSGPPPT